MKKILDSITVGDLLIYCPDDLNEEHHDVAIVYEICTDKEDPVIGMHRGKKVYRLFWNRGRDYNDFTEQALGWRLNPQDRLGVYMILKKQHEE